MTNEEPQFVCFSACAEQFEIVGELNEKYAERELGICCRVHGGIPDVVVLKVAYRKYLGGILLRDTCSRGVAW